MIYLHNCLVIATTLVAVGAFSQLRVDAFGVVSHHNLNTNNNPLINSIPSSSSSSAAAAAAFISTRTKTTCLNAEIGTEVFMPALSSTMKEGKVVSWLKSEGDAIEAGEAIMVVESDKADMDVEAFEDGYLAKILVEEGGMVPVGDAVALIAASEDEIDAVAAAATSGGASAPPAVESPTPEGGYLYDH